MSLLPLAILLVSLLAGLESVALADYSFSTIDYPTYTEGTYPTGINNTGQVVGYYLSVTYAPIYFLDTGGTFTNILDPAEPYPSAFGPTTTITGISGSGEIVGWHGPPLGTGFVYNGGTFTDFVYPPSVLSSDLIAISESGLILGGYETYIAGPSYIYLDNDGTFTSVGYLIGGTASALYLDNNDSIPFQDDFGLTGVNNAGEIVGYYADANGIDHGFLDNGGTLTMIDDPSASDLPGGDQGTVVTGINDLGQVVGYYYDSKYIPYGFVDNGGIFTTIADPLVVPTGLETGTYATGINDLGQIVGYYTTGQSSDYSDDTFGFVATPTTVSPEPSPLWVPLAAFLTMAFVRSRKLFLRLPANRPDRNRDIG